MNAQLTVPEVGERLRMNEQSVRKLIRRGELRASNVGGRNRPSYRVDESAVEDFLRDRAVTT
jgi:excisionase family DNA binding protein